VEDRIGQHQAGVRIRKRQHWARIGRHQAAERTGERRAAAGSRNQRKAPARGPGRGANQPHLVHKMK
jgi:hypothetical protein